MKALKKCTSKRSLLFLPLFSEWYKTTAFFATLSIMPVGLQHIRELDFPEVVNQENGLTDAVEYGHRVNKLNLPGDR